MGDGYKKLKNMRSTIEQGGVTYDIDLSKPLDISRPLIPGKVGPNCFFAPLFQARPYKTPGFVGSVKEGGDVNFYNLELNPHGNGTHTECVGHINKEQTPLNTVLHENYFFAHLISVYPQKMESGDRCITKRNLEILLDGEKTLHALIIRTQPNDKSKINRQYSGNNPPYFTPEAMQLIVDRGVKHLLVDLPSVDREKDGGALKAHKIFWQYHDSIRTECTITELIYVKDSIKDGNYFLNLQRLNIALDASPSRPILFEIE